jgi:hypothetical protein
LSARDKLANLKQTDSVSKYTDQFTSVILDLPNQMQEDLVHQYITGLKFYTQRELHKDLAHKMVPSLDVAIALAEQYDSIIFDKNNNDKNKSSKPVNKTPTTSTTSTMHTSSKQVYKPDTPSPSELGPTR